ncbi:hypothetical protein [Aeromonas molluscorum]
MIHRLLASRAVLPATIEPADTMTIACWRAGLYYLPQSSQPTP